MAEEKKRSQQMKIYLRDNCPQHSYLRRQCDNRNRKKYKTAADYLAAAVAKFESDDMITLEIDVRDFPDHVMDAVNVIRNYKNKRKRGILDE